MTAREIRVTFHADRESPNGDGLHGGDARVRALLKILVAYPGVRHILPDRISLDATAEPGLLERIARLLAGQAWLVRSVEID